MLLEDARVKMSEIEIDEPTTIMPDKTIYEAIQLMHGAGKQTCGVVDEENRVVGMLTMNDIGLVAMGDTAETEKLLEDVSPENINTAISGKLIYRAPDRHIRGRVSVVAITKEDIAIHDIRNKIVVAGDDPEAQKNIIEMGAGLLILVRTDKVSDEVLEVAKKHGCTVIISGHSTMNTSRYAYFAPPISKLMATKVVKFYANELAEDVGSKMMRTRFHAYPIVDENDRIVGCASRYHIMNSRNKKIILVDHNEFSQSVRAIDKAEVLEVIDHHRINDFSTKRPVAFRNEIIGSTATIVATMFRENQIPIPQNLAGLLLGAILSDTLKFQSPTTTEKDRRTANILAAIADLDIDDTDGNGPETITLHHINGDYTYTVFDYNLTKDIAKSGASVTVYFPDGTNTTIECPFEEGEFTNWDVFELHDGDFMEVNKLSFNETHPEGRR